MTLSGLECHCLIGEEGGKEEWGIRLPHHAPNNDSEEGGQQRLRGLTFWRGFVVVGPELRVRHFLIDLKERMADQLMTTNEKMTNTQLLTSFK